MKQEIEREREKKINLHLVCKERKRYRQNFFSPGMQKERKRENVSGPKTEREIEKKMTLHLINKERERDKKVFTSIQKERKSENESETRDRKGDRKADEPTPGM